MDFSVPLEKYTHNLFIRGQNKNNKLDLHSKMIFYHNYFEPNEGKESLCERMTVCKSIQNNVRCH